MSKRTITIGPYTFTIRAGYQDSEFEVGRPEREALDRLRAERIRKKAWKVFEKLRAQGDKRTLTEAQLKHLTTEVAKLDEEVRLEEKSPGTTGKDFHRARGVIAPEADATGLFEEELTKLVAGRIDAEERMRGVTLTPDQREAAANALREEPLLREQARERVEVALAERERMISELF